MTMSLVMPVDRFDMHVYLWWQGDNIFGKINEMGRLLFVVLVFVGAVILTSVPLQAQDLTETVRTAVITTVKEKTGRTLIIKGGLSFSMQPQPVLSAKQVMLSNPEGFDATPFIVMDQIDVTFDLAAALTGNMVINGFVMKKPSINLMVNKTGANNWSFGAKALQAGVFEMSNATVVYSDLQKEVKHTLTNVNLKVNAPTISDALKASGDLTWRNEKITLVASLETPELLNNGSAAKIGFKLNAKKFSVDLSGKFSKQKDGFKLADIKLLADDMQASGKMSFKYGKARPYVGVDFKLDRLNLTKYLASQMKKTKNVTGWSKNEIDFTSLRKIDGDFKLTAEAVHYQNIRTGAATLKARLHRGVLSVKMPKLALYEGAARLNLSVNGRKSKAALKFDGNFKDVNALPFLRDAVDIAKIEGRVNLGFNLTAAGRSLHDFMKTLRGNADVNFRDGALLGIDIARILRSVQRGKTSGFAKGGKTPYGKIVARFRFRKGIGRNKKLRISGGAVRISGGGRVRMPNRTLSYRVHPSLVGRGGISVLGINVPIIISGPWANPQIYPDLPGFLDAPEIALKGLVTVGEGGVKGAVGVVKTITKPIGEIITSPLKKLF